MRKADHLFCKAYLANWSFYVSDDRSVWVVKKLDSDLCDVTGVTSAAKNLVHFRKFYWLILETYLIMEKQLYNDELDDVTSRSLNPLYDSASDNSEFLPC